jgi:dephospho-CoA kinase
MNNWAGKYIIGLTGNIASGKSVVRKILERLGGYGIDADRLAHRALLKGTPTYQRVIERFGKDILDEQENINRKALGQVVFANPNALNDLEAIIHPFVCHTIEQIIKQTPRQLVIIEAIKLIESGLTEYCHSLWVVYASNETRRSRLMTARALSAAEAELSINAQPSQRKNCPPM